MANKDYTEDGDGSNLPGKVKGSEAEHKAASYKPLSLPGAAGGAGDQESFDGGKGGVSMPKEPSSLGKAPGKTV